jgi:hypothetical protein
MNAALEAVSHELFPDEFEAIKQRPEVKAALASASTVARLIMDAEQERATAKREFDRISNERNAHEQAAIAARADADHQRKHIQRLTERLDRISKSHERLESILREIGQMAASGLLDSHAASVTEAKPANPTERIGGAPAHFGGKPDPTMPKIVQQGPARFESDITHTLERALMQ